MPFLQRVCGTQRLARALARHGVDLSRMALGLADRDLVKDALLVSVLAGQDAAELDAAGEAYAALLVNSGRLRPDTVNRLEQHLVAGHQVVLVSASPLVYLAPLGRRLGVDAVLATALEVNTCGRLTGRLLGRNCRGDEKVSRLEAWMAAAGGPPGRLYAYGDSDGDRQLLARADVGVRVRARRPLPPLNLVSREEPG